MSQPKKAVRWLVAAREDLLEIVAYIANRAPQTAERFAEKLLGRIEILADHPHIGSVCPYYRKARQLIHGHYVIYYTVHRQEVVIRAVVRGARLFRSAWMRRS